VFYRYASCDREIHRTESSLSINDATPDNKSVTDILAGLASLEPRPSTDLKLTINGNKTECLLIAVMVHLKETMTERYESDKGGRITVIHRDKGQKQQPGDLHGIDVFRLEPLICFHHVDPAHCYNYAVPVEASLVDCCCCDTTK
jgi:hypothetical protein